MRTIAVALSTLFVAACHDDTGAGGSEPPRLLGSYFASTWAFGDLIEYGAESGEVRILTGTGMRGFDQLHAIAWNPEVGMLQAIDFPRQTIVNVDIETGYVVPVQPTTGTSIRDLAVRNGVLHGVDIGSDALVVLEASKAPRVLPDHGFESIQSLAYHAASDRFFGCDNQTDQLVAIDPVTGAATAVGPLNIVGTPNILTMFESLDGASLFAASGPAIWQVDLDTGAATLVGVIGEDVLGATGLPTGVYVGTADLIGDSVFDGKQLVEFELPGLATRPSLSFGVRLCDSVALTPSGSAVLAVDGSSDRTRIIDLSSGAAADIGAVVFPPDVLTRNFEGNGVVGVSSSNFGRLDFASGLFVPQHAFDLNGLTGSNSTDSICAGFSPGMAFLAANDRLLTVDLDLGKVLEVLDPIGLDYSGIERVPGMPLLRVIESSGLTHILDPSNGSSVVAEQLFPVQLGVNSLTYVASSNEWLTICGATDQLLRRRSDGSIGGIGCFGLGSVEGLATDFESKRVWAITRISSARMIVRIEKGLRTWVENPTTALNLPAFVEDIAYVPSRDRIYASTNTSPMQLFEIDPSTGTATSLGNLARPVVVGETDGTLLLGIDKTARELVSIDIDTLTITTIGAHTQSLRGLAFVPELGELRAVDTTNADLVRLDPTTGAATVIGPTTHVSFALTAQPW